MKQQLVGLFCLRHTRYLSHRDLAMHICISRLLIDSDEYFRSRKFTSDSVIFYKPQCVNCAEGFISTEIHQHQYQVVFIANYQEVWLSPKVFRVDCYVAHWEKKPKNDRLYCPLTWFPWLKYIFNVNHCSIPVGAIYMATKFYYRSGRMQHIAIIRWTPSSWFPWRHKKCGWCWPKGQIEAMSVLSVNTTYSYLISEYIWTMHR